MAAAAKTSAAPQRWTQALTVPPVDNHHEHHAVFSSEDSPQKFAQTLDTFTNSVRQADAVPAHRYTYAQFAPNYWTPVGTMVDNVAKTHRGAQTASAYVAGLLPKNTYNFWFIERTLENCLADGQPKAALAAERVAVIEHKGFTGWLERIKQHEIGERTGSAIPVAHAASPAGAAPPATET